MHALDGVGVQLLVLPTPGWTSQGMLSLQFFMKPTFMIPSPIEDKDLQLSLGEEKVVRAKHYTEGRLQCPFFEFIWKF